MESGEGSELSGRRRASRLAHFAAWSRVIKEIQPTTDSISGGMSVVEATERRWTRSSLACWLLGMWTERPVISLSAAALPLEMVMLVVRMNWAGVIGCRNIISKVSLVTGVRRDSVGDGEGDQGGIVAGSAVYADIYAAEAGMDDGGTFPSSDFIVRG